MSERAFAITSRQIEQIVACLRLIEEARNRLKATTSRHIEICDDLTKCTMSMYKLLSQLQVISKS